VYLARSHDGGETFENFKVSEAPFKPDPSVFFGDYINVAARAGRVYPIWMRMDSTDLSVWVALVDESMGVEVVEGEELPGVFKLSPNYPNPFNSTTTICFELPHSAMVNLSLYNIRGQLVKRLINEWKNAGSHAFIWEARGLSSGIYLYKIAAGSHSAARKCLLVR